MSETLKIAVVLGSTREGRFCDNVAAWAVNRLNAEIGIDVDVVDPAQLDLPCRHELDPAPALVALGLRLAAAEAFVIVTPEYNRSYTAALKFVIDSFHVEWQAKPVAFVSYGGLSGGLRAVEHLRGVLAELHAVAIRDTVSFASAWERFGSDGELDDPREAERAFTLMMKRLRWWTIALRNARSSQPYEHAA